MNKSARIVGIVWTSVLAIIFWNNMQYSMSAYVVTVGLSIYLISMGVYKKYTKNDVETFDDEIKIFLDVTKLSLNVTSKIAVIIGMYGLYNVIKGIHIASFKTLSNQELTEKIMHLYGLVGIFSILAATILMWYITKKTSDKL